MWYFYASCGVVGLAIVGLAAFVFIAGLLTMILAKSRTAVLLVLVLALLPLLVGIAGTLSGYRNVELAAQAGDVPEEAIRMGKAVAMHTTYLGAAATAILLVLGVLAALAKGSREEASDASAVPEHHR